LGYACRYMCNILFISWNWGSVKNSNRSTVTFNLMWIMKILSHIEANGNRADDVKRMVELFLPYYRYWWQILKTVHLLLWYCVRTALMVTSKMLFFAGKTGCGRATLFSDHKVSIRDTLRELHNPTRCTCTIRTIISNGIRCCTYDEFDVSFSTHRCWSRHGTDDYSGDHSMRRK
jgi:hypothetical protein